MPSRWRWVIVRGTTMSKWRRLRPPTAESVATAAAATIPGFAAHVTVPQFLFVSVEEGGYRENWLPCSIVYYYNVAQRYEQFLQVVDWIGFGLALCLPITSVSSVFTLPYIQKKSCLHLSVYLLVSWAWCDWPLTWLTNHRPSVIWHCWLGHLTRKTVSEMSAMLHPTIP